MGYLDKTTITVDAILTNRGRELLSLGSSLPITKFAVADDEVDYGLYNTAHPLGSNYYGAVIENMPVLEATPDETQIMRYKLITITDNQTGTVVIPQITNIVTPIGGTLQLFFNETEGPKTIELTPQTTYSVGDNQTESYTLLLADSSVATVQVTDPSTQSSVGSNGRGSITANGRKFKITAKNITRSTSITIFGSTSGAVYNFTLSTTASA